MTTETVRQMCQCGHPESSHTDRGYLGFKAGRCWISGTPGCDCTEFEPETLL